MILFSQKKSESRTFFPAISVAKSGVAGKFHIFTYQYNIDELVDTSAYCYGRANMNSTQESLPGPIQKIMKKYTTTNKTD